MAGYSTTPQATKLGIKPGHTVLLDHCPTGWSLQDPLPDSTVRRRATQADVVVSFVRAAAVVAQRIADRAETVYPAGALWIAWPRKAAGHVSDVTENLIRDSALTIGLVDVKVAAIDDDWSGLKLVWRKENRNR